MNGISSFLMLFGGGFVLGWATGNLVYGRQGCKDCFIALIRGKRCDECEERKKVVNDGTR